MNKYIKIFLSIIVIGFIYALITGGGYALMFLLPIIILAGGFTGGLMLGKKLFPADTTASTTLRAFITIMTVVIVLGVFLTVIISYDLIPVI